MKLIVSQKKTIFLMTLKDKLCKILVTVSSKCSTVIDQINENPFSQVIIVKYNIPKTIRGDSISSFSWIFYSAIWEKDKIDMVLRVLFEIKKKCTYSKDTDKSVFAILDLLANFLL